MIVHAHIQIEIDGNDLTEIFDDLDDTFACALRREVEEAIRKSEAWRDLKMAVYNAVLGELREQLVKDFELQKKGES